MKRLELTKIQYKYLTESFNNYAKKIIDDIELKYQKYFDESAKEEIKKIKTLYEKNDNFIVFERNGDGYRRDRKVYTKDENISFGHSGQGRGDGKIHIYPFTNPLNYDKLDNTNMNEFLTFIKETIIHEIFHFLTRKDIVIDENNQIEKYAYIQYREACVDTVSRIYCQENNIPTISGYVLNVFLLKEIMKNKNFSIDEIYEYLFNSNQKILDEDYFTSFYGINEMNKIGLIKYPLTCLKILNSLNLDINDLNDKKIFYQYMQILLSKETLEDGLDCLNKNCNLNLELNILDNNQCYKK